MTCPPIAPDNYFDRRPNAAQAGGGTVIGGCWALIPLKATVEAKSRLSDTLNPAQRADLQGAMLDDLLDGLATSAQLAGITLYGSCRERTSMNYSKSLICLNQPAHVSTLNEALTEGTKRLTKMGARIIVVLPGDLPLAQGAELDHTLSYVTLTGNSVVVPDRWKHGTNGLIFPAHRPPIFQMGCGSLYKHLRAQAQCRSHDLPSFALDIDTADDLGHFRGVISEQGRHTRQFIEATIPKLAAPCASKETGT